MSGAGCVVGTKIADDQISYFIREGEKRRTVRGLRGEWMGIWSHNR